MVELQDVQLFWVTEQVKQGNVHAVHTLFTDTWFEGQLLTH